MLELRLGRRPGGLRAPLRHLHALQRRPTRHGADPSRRRSFGRSAAIPVRAGCANSGRRGSFGVPRGTRTRGHGTLGHRVRSARRPPLQRCPAYPASLAVPRVPGPRPRPLVDRIPKLWCCRTSSVLTSRNDARPRLVLFDRRHPARRGQVPWANRRRSGGGGRRARADLLLACSAHEVASHAGQPRLGHQRRLRAVVVMADAYAEILGERLELELVRALVEQRRAETAPRARWWCGEGGTRAARRRRPRAGCGRGPTARAPCAASLERAARR